MAIFKTSPFLRIQNQADQFSASSGQSSSNLFQYNNLSYRFKHCERKRLKLKTVREMEGCNGYVNGVIEDDRRLVEVLREAQPYIDLHRCRTFVVVFSAEVVDGPHLYSLLQVLPLCN